MLYFTLYKPFNYFIMKKNKQNHILVLIGSLLLMSLASCQKEETQNAFEYPKDMKAVILSGIHPGLVKIAVWNVCTMEIDKNNNLLPCGIKGEAEIVDLGLMSDILDINAIPTTGWSPKVQALQRHGYIVRSLMSENKNDYRYARIFLPSYSWAFGSDENDWLDEYLVGELWYQSPWNP